LDPFETLNNGRPFADQIKPSNFLLSVTVDRLGHAASVQPARYKRFHLVRPFATDLESLTDAPWIDIHTGEEFQITTEWPGDPDSVRVKTFGDVRGSWTSYPDCERFPCGGCVAKSASASDAFECFALATAGRILGRARRLSPH